MSMERIGQAPYPQYYLKESQVCLKYFCIWYKISPLMEVLVAYRICLAPPDESERMYSRIMVDYLGAWARDSGLLVADGCGHIFWAMPW